MTGEEQTFEEQTPEEQVPKKKRGFMGIKLVDVKSFLKPGCHETRYGIEFVVQEDGQLIGETKTAIAKAGIDAGLYQEIK